MSDFNCSPVDTGPPSITGVDVTVDGTPYDEINNPIKPGSEVRLIVSVINIASLTYAFYEEDSGVGNPFQQGASPTLNVDDLDPSDSYPFNYAIPGTNLKCFITATNSIATDTLDEFIGLVNGLPPEEPSSLDIAFLSTILTTTPELGSVVSPGDDIVFTYKSTFTPGNPDINEIETTIDDQQFIGSSFTFTVTESSGSDCVVVLNNLTYSNEDGAIPGTGVVTQNFNDLPLFAIYSPDATFCTTEPGRCCYPGVKDPETEITPGNCFQTLPAFCTGEGREYEPGLQCPDCDNETENAGLPCCDSKPRGRCCYMGTSGFPANYPCVDNEEQSVCENSGGIFNQGATCYYAYPDDWAGRSNEFYPNGFQQENAAWAPPIPPWNVPALYDMDRAYAQCSDDPEGGACGCPGACCNGEDCDDQFGEFGETVPGRQLDGSLSCPNGYGFYTGRKCDDCLVFTGDPDFENACCFDEYPTVFRSKVVSFRGNSEFDEPNYAKCYSILPDDDPRYSSDREAYENEVEGAPSSGFGSVLDNVSCKDPLQLNKFLTGGCGPQRYIPNSTASTPVNPCYARETLGENWMIDAEYINQLYGDVGKPCELDGICDCYEVSNGPGCGGGGLSSRRQGGGIINDVLVTRCEEAVCKNGGFDYSGSTFYEADSYCCDNEWDNTCASTAEQICTKSTIPVNNWTTGDNRFLNIAAYYFSHSVECEDGDGDEPCVKDFNRFKDCMVKFGYSGSGNFSLQSFRDEPCPGDWSGL